MLDLQTGDKVARLGWIGDRIQDHEGASIQAMRTIAGSDLETLERILAYEWIEEAPTGPATQALETIASMAQKHPDLSRQITSIHWLADGIEDSEASALLSTDEIAAVDPHIGRKVSTYSWFVDGVTESERSKMRVVRNAFKSLSDLDLDLAKIVADYPWLSEDIDMVGFSIISLLSENLAGIAESDVELARMVAGRDWLADNVDRNEHEAISALMWFAVLDLEFSRKLADIGWFEDGINYGESTALWAMANLMERDMEFSRRVFDLIEPGVEFDHSGVIVGLDRLWHSDQGTAIAILQDLESWPANVGSEVLSTLSSLRRSYPDRYNDLLARSWFLDGVNLEEALFISTIWMRLRASSELHDQMMDQYHLETKTVAMPMGGMVKFWLFSNKPIDARDGLMDNLTRGARDIEQFIQVPFPSRNFVVSFADGHALGAAWQSGYHILLGRVEQYDQIGQHTVFHETGHFYMSGNIGRTWLSEGGANFLATVVLANLGSRNLEHRANEIQPILLRACELALGVSTLQELIDYDRDARQRSSCNYVLGEYFLLKLHSAIGRDAVSRALGDIYLNQFRSSVGVSEEDVYQAFLANTPDLLEEDLVDVYRVYYGGHFLPWSESSVPEHTVSDEHLRELRDVISWSQNPFGGIHAAAFAEIADVWLQDANFGLSLAVLEWVADGINHKELMMLRDLNDLYEFDPRLAQRMIDLTWVEDGIRFWEQKAVSSLAGIAERDIGEAETISRYRWFVDDMSNQERLLVEFLDTFSSAVEQANRATPRIDWMLDGLTDEEHRSLVEIRRMFVFNTGFGLRVLQLPWVADNRSNSSEISNDIYPWANLVEADVELARDVIELSWVSDDLEGHEDAALGSIGAMALVNVDEARRIVRSGWFRDGIDLDDVIRLQNYLVRLHSLMSSQPSAPEVVLRILKSSRHVDFPITSAQVPPQAIRYC